ncbi:MULTISPECIES: YgdI/YgdR family lipoprotein [unclassified Pseudomonas]|uniref:YgdI/YgdR family lipoprotein n=1 Tax=unclassified Pseudomonas TaxID=196821 RepID=UPI00244A21FD|nr:MULTISPECIES: YgdI/YgdR family lipoprotein [unclassified Pseudomonas]MDG9923659.1 YgdI/YgdR family lipoprotein [Pseudomonas sp. GD04045]MDH0036421.1 YgdI/YgdR family lipoprotein [Pseudomonas sp. GD04019]
MKHWLLAFFCLAALTGCASEYLLVTTDGQILTSDGKPELDDDTGMYEFEDSEGRKQHIPQNQIKQMMER